MNAKLLAFVLVVFASLVGCQKQASPPAITYPCTGLLKVEGRIIDMPVWVKAVPLSNSENGMYQIVEWGRDRFQNCNEVDARIYHFHCWQDTKGTPGPVGKKIYVFQENHR